MLIVNEIVATSKISKVCSLIAENNRFSLIVIDLTGFLARLQTKFLIFSRRTYMT